MRAALLVLALFLLGCPTREFYLRQAQLDWDIMGVRRLQIPAFTAPPEAWTLAESARRALVAELDRGTVQVVESAGDARLEGAVLGWREASRYGPPRRLARQATATTWPGDAYYWEADATHRLDFRLALRVTDARGRVLWARESAGGAEETAAQTLPWPGHETMAPPATLVPAPVAPAARERLLARAREQALGPIVEALAAGYAYRPL